MNDVISVQLAISKLHLHSLLEQPPSENVAMQALAELNTALAELEATNAELNQQVQSFAELNRAHQIEARRYQQLFEKVPVAYLVTDRYGVIEEANTAAEELLNVPRELLRSKPISVFVPPDDRRAFRARLDDLSSSSVWEVVLRPRNLGVITVQLDVAEIASDRYKTRLGWVMQNVTPQRAAAAAEKLLAREVALRTEAQAAVTRLRALHVALETIGHNSSLPRPERIASFLEEFVPRFARRMSCELPAEAPIAVGDIEPADQVLQTVIPRTHGGRLIARRGAAFTAEDSAILIAASNAIGLLFCRI